MDKKPTVGDYVRTGSCLGDPQGNAVRFLRARELTLFTDLINEPDVEGKSKFPLPETHWINQPLAEEDDKTLLMLAIDLKQHDFVQVILKVGGSTRLLNRELGKAPIHYAALKNDLRTLKMCFARADNSPDINAVMPSNGRTALHICAEKKFEDSLEFLIQQVGVEVDVKDKRNATPLYLAVKSGSESAALKLVQAGADFRHSCFGRPIFPDLIADKLPHFDPTQVRRKVVPLVKQFSVATMERMVEIIEREALMSDSHSYYNNDGQDLQEFKSLLLQSDSATLNSFQSGGLTILQKACEGGLHDYVKALLMESGVDPNQATEATPLHPALIAASGGFPLVLQVLAEHGADFTGISAESKETILHYLLKKGVVGNDDHLKCLEFILHDGQIHGLKKIVNKRDCLGNTALHYATQKWPQEIVRKLLEIGGNIGMKNHWHETPISKISPDTMEAFLDEYCIESKGDVNHENFEVTYNYSFLAPPKEDLPEAAGIDFGNDPENQKLSGQDENQKIPLPETLSLWYMGQSKEHRHLLKHPVVTSFLYLKWQRIRRYFNRNLRFYMLFVFVLTWFIFDKFGGMSIRDETKEIPFWHGLFILFSIIAFIFIMRDWTMDIMDTMAAEKMRKKNPINEKEITSGKMCCWIVLSNWVEVLYLMFLGVLIVGGPQFLWLALVILTLLLAVREFLQVTVSLKRYLFGPENWIEVSMIVLIGFILVLDDEGEDIVSLKRHMAAIAIVLSWAELITLVGKHPKLTRYNVYVTMFYKVMATFFFFLCWYVFFIIAFGLGFYIMLHKDGPNDAAGEDDYIFFNKPWLALVKTSTMFVGELEFSDIPIDVESRLSPVSYLFFLSFVFLIVVVLMNLLNGLAVSDTGAIQEKAEIVGYISQVETISYTESVLLGDPFNFLSNWPALKWLLNVPSCSICSHLYRNKFIQLVFHKVTGATGILLFYKYLPTKKLKLTPNDKKGGCGFLQIDVMNEDILKSTKSIILSQQKRQDEEEKANLKENRAQQKIAELERKIDLLLKKMDK